MPSDRIELGKRALRMRDTFDLRNHQRTVDDIESSSSDDDIRELSKAEEQALRRSFRQIQTGPTEDHPSAFSSVIRKQINEDEVLDDWSDDQGQPMGRMEDEMTNRGYDSTGDKTTINRAYDPVHQFQTHHTRDGTPDSTASSGQRIIFNKKDNRPTEFNPTNIDTHKQSNIGKSVRVLVAGLDETAVKGIAELRAPADNYDSGVYSYASFTNKDREQTFEKKKYESGSDGGSIKSEETYVKTIAPSPPQEYEHVNRSAVEPRLTNPCKRLTCLRRCVFLAVGIMVVLVAVVALLVYFKEDDRDADHGSVLDNPIMVVKNDCPDVNISVGNQIVIQCWQDIDSNTVNTTNSLRVTVLNIKPQQVTGNSFTANKTVTNETVIWNITGPIMTCSLAGTYRIEYIRNVTDIAISVLHTTTTRVRVHPNVSTLTTHISQRIVNDVGGSRFDVGCYVNKVCKNYEINWVARKDSTSVLLDQHKSCNVAFDDKSGYSIQCNGSIPAEDVQTHSDNGNLYCQLSYGDDYEAQEEFKLPDCDQNCSVITNKEHICKDDDNPTNETCDSMKQCFPVDRFYTSCSESNTCPVNENCTLKWCRNISTRKLNTYRNLLKELCQENSTNITFALDDTR